jgi:hypothetical protein
MQPAAWCTVSTASTPRSILIPKLSIHNIDKKGDVVVIDKFNRGQQEQLLYYMYTKARIFSIIGCGVPQGSILTLGSENVSQMQKNTSAQDKYLADFIAI